MRPRIFFLCARPAGCYGVWVCVHVHMRAVVCEAVRVRARVCVREHAMCVLAMPLYYVHESARAAAKKEETDPGSSMHADRAYPDGVDESEDEGEQGDDTDSDEEEVSDRSAAEVQAVERLLALEKAADAAEPGQESDAGHRGCG
jgi:hypothetical protein